MLCLRNGTLEDMERIMEIYSYAQEYMIRSGNPSQWGHSYPGKDLIRTDIRQGACKVIYDENGIHGVFALFEEPDPTYSNIENGQWLNDTPYLTIHRIAGDGKVHGLFQYAVNCCKQKTSNIRIDTHRENKTMQRLIEQNGFRKCGTIYVRDGSARIAYQWTAL